MLVLWLKEQDASPAPLVFLNDLLASLESAFDKHGSKITLAYDVLGPRSSATLSAMLAELKSVQPGSPVAPFNLLNSARFFSPYATAEDTFLLNYSPNEPSGPYRTGKQAEGIENKKEKEINEEKESKKIPQKRPSRSSLTMRESSSPERLTQTPCWRSSFFES